MPEDRKPIFLLWTRSFWMTFIGLAAALFGAGDGVLMSLGSSLDALVGAQEPFWGETLVTLAPAALWLLALRERAGAARPYTMNIKATN